MARRIVALQGLGFRKLSTEELFAGVDMDEIRLTTFPEPWRFKPDQDNAGVKGKWYEPDIDIAKWIAIRTDEDQGWNARLFGPENRGYGWYRAPLPAAAADLAKKHKYLFFGAVDEDCWVYLNGEMVFDHSFETTGLIPVQIWMTSFTVPLTDVALQSGDAVVDRVKNTDGTGGIWKPVHLIATDQPLTPQQVLVLVKLRRPKATP